METTGVVRRIDDLGRIVIPKEIRRTLRIKEGSSLEIFVENDMVALKKYSSMNSLNDFAELFADSISQSLRCNVVITDTDSVVACAGLPKKEYIGAHISEYLEECLENRGSIVEKELSKLEIIEGNIVNASYVINTIVSNGDAVGLILILVDNKEVSDIESKMALIASQFLGKHIEE